MRRHKLLRCSILAVGLACAWPAIPQSTGGAGQTAPGATEERRGDDTGWGWLGLLGLIGLAGLRRRDNRDRSYGGRAP